MRKRSKDQKTKDPKATTKTSQGLGEAPGLCIWIYLLKIRTITVRDNLGQGGRTKEKEKKLDSLLSPYNAPGIILSTFM